jgi:hypothetical protein
MCKNNLYLNYEGTPLIIYSKKKCVSYIISYDDLIYL